MLEGMRTSPAIVLPQVLSIFLIDKLAQVIEANTWKHEASELDEATPPSKCKALEVFVSHVSNDEQAAVIVAGDHNNWESVASALVLVKSVGSVIGDVKLAPHFLGEKENVPSSTQVSILVLSNGAFQEAYFVKSLLDIAYMKSKIIPIIVEDGFRFPSEQLLKEIRATAATKFPLFGLKENPDTICVVVKSAFKEIAVVFAPADYSSNEQLLRTKAMAITDRVKSGNLQTLSLQTVVADTSAQNAADTDDV